MKYNRLISGVFLLSSLVFAGDSLRELASFNGLKAIPNNKKELYKIIDPKGLLTPQKILLGKKLYFEPRLSKASDISCASCHILDAGGDDNIPVAIGHNGAKNPHHLNSPTVYNAVFFNAQFWDGRSPTLEDQAKGPIQAPPEMAMTPKEVVKRINAIPEYVAEFKKAYNKDVKIDFDLITSTIGLYERTLVTPSPFDDYLNGDDKALSKAEKDGLRKFIEIGCTGCHTGIALGGTMQPFDVGKDFKFAHVGDFKGGKNGLVKVGTLRNITETSPYFHNGTMDKLEDVIKEMAKIQLGKKISDDDIKSIMVFLKSLKGRKGDTSAPTLPPIKK
jgi:cytochrome c peroxidase